MTCLCQKLKYLVIYKKWQVKFTLGQDMKAPRGNTGIAPLFSTLSLTSALDGGEGWVRGSTSRPFALPPGKRPGTHCTGDLLSPRAGLDGCGRYRPHRDSIPAVQPVASRYTDWAIVAYPHEIYIYISVSVLTYRSHRQRSAGCQHASTTADV